MFFVSSGLTESYVEAAGFFAIVGIIAQSLAYQLPRGVSGNISFIPFLSALALAPGIPLVLAVLLAVTAGEIIQRRQRQKALFNVAQYTLAISLSILTYVTLGGRPIRTEHGWFLLPFIASFAMFLLVNTASVSGVMAVSSGRNVFAIWRENTRGAILYDFFAVPVVYAFAYVYQTKGAAWAAGVALPLFGLRQLYKTNYQLETLNEELLQLIVATVEARDPYTSGHSERVAAYSRVVSRAAGLSSRATQRVAIAALLHDVGKIHEEFAAVLKKPGRLSAEEFAIMKTHASKGADLVQKVSQFRDLVPAVRSHHEAWDGSGYPEGLAGSNIPQWARIIAFADTIDAMTTDRPYRGALTSDTVRTEIVQESGRQFDPEIAVRLTSGPFWAELEKLLVRTPSLVASVPDRSHKTLSIAVPAAAG